MRYMLAIAAALFAASAANADGGHPLKLTGKAADAFIAKYFPQADIPGPVSGSFRYFKHGRTHVGRAGFSPELASDRL